MLLDILDKQRPILGLHGMALSQCTQAAPLGEKCP